VLLHKKNSGKGVSFVSSTPSKSIPVIVAVDVVGLVELVVVVAKSAARGIASVLR
jgi:hypothetical protein